ncbi:hypothetical protein CEXT_252431 [Caerostris extrusa]|uniref:Uncharacterized protein n=1 Tax=Caerostris extrusa TaxID=172846 RepID=A0AAV4SGI1_CAEEX|nr:hypothetical protein CEXT_252431 [Caerostris extrusa]
MNDLTRDFYSKMMDRTRTWVLLDFDSSRIAGGRSFICDPSTCQSETTVVADSLSLWNRLIKYLPGVTCVPLCSWPGLISISQQR